MLFYILFRLDDSSHETPSFMKKHPPFLIQGHKTKEKVQNFFSCISKKNVKLQSHGEVDSYLKLCESPTLNGV